MSTVAEPLNYRTSLESDRTMENSIDNRLAVYGTLAPGRCNHNQLSSLKGTWRKGTVVGTLLKTGWAVEQGYPALVLSQNGSIIDVQIFESLELPAHWQRLDQFEGPQYQRVATEVNTEDGLVSAWIYASTELENN